MTQEEMKKKFNELYQLMSSSQNVAFMRVFGNVHKEMMEWMISNKPEMAQEWIEKLCSIKWRNFLTRKEAERIVAEMMPKAPWGMEQWKATMGKYGLGTSEEPYYNSNALFVEMNKMYSDFGDTLAELVGKPLSASDADIITACYKMALNTLKDKDKVYDIRHYFHL